MKFFRIITDRHYQKWPSWDIVYEWEDELSVSLDIPIANSPTKDNPLYRIFLLLNNKIFKGKINNLSRKNYRIDPIYSIYFEMHPKDYKNFSNSKWTIPIIIDFWKKSNIELFLRLYFNCPYLLITSLEALTFLQENQSNNKLVHFPISLPSIYKLESTQVVEKKYDIILPGRINRILFEYLKQYEKDHPDIEYLYQVQKDGELFYRSNKNRLIGKFHSRKKYMNLIQSAKIAFYATPGIDGGEKRTNGFNPVTPRFLELLSAGCHIVARYPKNADTDFFQLETICPSITSYDKFKERMNIVLHTAPPILKNEEYLRHHYTSKRVEILKRLL
ncbi:MAG: hypothetical protein D3913_00670 [Candidatus Electrothrix sp. LOE1_4_5]|nr:hypothetical protein [Candidatus Electrothrix gigas]